MSRAGSWIAFVLLVALPLGLWIATPLVRIPPAQPSTGGFRFESPAIDLDTGLPVFDEDARFSIDRIHEPSIYVPPSELTTIRQGGQTFSFIGGSPAGTGLPESAQVKLSLYGVEGFGRWTTIIESDMVQTWVVGENDRFEARVVPQDFAEYGLKGGRYRAQLSVQLPGELEPVRYVSDPFFLIVSGPSP